MSQTQTPFRPAARVGRITSSALRDLLALVEKPGVISLAGGLPAEALFPTQRTRRLLDEMLGADPTALQYSATEGQPALREWIAARHGVGVDQVVVTHGSQQGLDLVARAVLDPGDTVVLADPGYVGAVQALALSGGRLTAVPGDDDGLDVSVLERRLRGGLRPRLVYVVPHFHNPTGAVLSVARAGRLAALAERYGFVLVEDDPYREIHFDGPPAPPLCRLSAAVVTMGTVSKTLFPGLRVGWVVAPPALARTLALVKQATDLHTSTLAQRLVGHLLGDAAFFDAHLARLRTEYGHRARTLWSALTEAFGAELDVRPATGGMFLWARLTRPDADTDTEALLRRAVEHGVGYVPGTAFSVAGDHRRYLRLSYAGVDPADLVTAADRLAAALRPEAPRRRRHCAL